MAYLTCPDCRMPNDVGDDAVRYHCYSCGKCEKRCAIPRRRLYSTSTKARAVRGYGHVYPKF